MTLLNTLFILPDSKNERVLVHVDGNRLPSYLEHVGENVAFDEPQIFNDYFKNITGIPVYRRYTFNTQNYVVFVFELADKHSATTQNGFDWVSYDDFITTACNAEILDIVGGVKLYYNCSTNMPWVNADGFAPYFKWLSRACETNGIQINGEITQVKNAYVSNVFCVPTSIGNVYMKTPGTIYINELPFTKGLREMNINTLPGWVDFDLDMNVVLMNDMGGNDLPGQSDISTWEDVILEYAHIQKNSIQHMPLEFEHYDNTVAAILHKLKTFPIKSYEILKGTPYELSQDELNKLLEHANAATTLLESINHISIPETIHGGDVRPGNIRVVNGKYIFYDWAWGGVAHPFIEIVSFLHIVRRTFADEQTKEILIDAYLKQWLDYGTYNDLKHTFTVLATLRDLFFALVDYDWVEAIVQSCDEAISPLSADGWLLEKRNYYFANVLRRFIETPLVAK
ncbi:MAG: hypothetical protein FWC92_02340 [Defluviitaleaceae bacterium]|nr:hypothetical protein [Defluviitaleaceae bacterium]